MPNSPPPMTPIQQLVQLDNRIDRMEKGVRTLGWAALTVLLAGWSACTVNLPPCKPCPPPCGQTPAPPSVPPPDPPDTPPDMDPGAEDGSDEGSESQEPVRAAAQNSLPEDLLGMPSLGVMAPNDPLELRLHLGRIPPPPAPIASGAPDANQITQAIALLRHSGILVEAVQGAVLRARATVGQVQEAFGVQMHAFGEDLSHPAGYGPVQDPNTIAVMPLLAVHGISGLDRCPEPAPYVDALNLAANFGQPAMTPEPMDPSCLSANQHRSRCVFLEALRKAGKLPADPSCAAWLPAAKPSDPSPKGAL